MNKTGNNKPVIFVDQQKYRLRIYKRTLHMLGDPEYIQLLINPDDLTVAIRCANQTDEITHRIIWKNIINKKCYELYSRYLIEKLVSICVNWNKNESYRLFGEIIPSENIARFNLSEVVSASEQEAKNE